MAKLLGYYAVLGGISMMGADALAYTNFNMGMSLNTGSALGAPIFPYGGAMGSMNALGGCFGSAGYLGGSGMLGGGMNLPPPPSMIIPPHLQGGGFLGGGMPGSPFLPSPGGCTTYCQPTYPYAMNQGLMMNQGTLAAQGGPLVASAGGGMSAAGGQASNVVSVAAGGTTIIDMRPRVEDNTGDVVWAAALGIGMQAPNVYPFVGDRGSPTNFGPFFYQEGDRDWMLQQRPHASQ
jgi:hypothetical protein